MKLITVYRGNIIYVANIEPCEPPKVIRFISTVVVTGILIHNNLIASSKMKDIFLIR